MRFLEYFRPENYRLDLKIDKNQEVITGEVVVTGQLQPDSHQILLHAEAMTISDVWLNGQLTDWQHADDVLTIEAPSQPAGDLQLKITYHVGLRHDMVGAYLSTYQHEGKTERIVGTQFESHYARNCFPCIDEPAAKATFDLTLTVPDATDTVLANTSPTHQETLSVEATAALFPQVTEPCQGQRVVFATTPRMSTYLLAFVIGKFHAATTQSQHGVTITTYVALNQPLESIEFANQIAADALDFYDDQFGVPYPLTKLDQVGLPDFSAGAMENWGLVTYRESCLLVEPAAAVATRRAVASTIVHELSHQWFGDLVTMQWWDELWLNESFANAMECFALDHLHPEYDIWSTFWTNDCVRALRSDANQGIQAVQQAVEDVKAIDSLFDGAIVYAKGAHLMVMLVRLLGEDNFFAGLRTYFAEHAYQNTTGDDLWAALQPHANFNVREFMHYWITQPGFPVLERQGDTWEQHRFTYEMDQATPSAWPLPKVTDDLTGHYLIKLSDAEFQDKLAHFGELSTEQQLRLIIDRMMLTQSPEVDSASLLDLFTHCADVDNAAVWDVLVEVAADLKFLCPKNSEGYPLLQAYFRKVIPNLTQRLGFVKQPNESQNQTDLRTAIVGLGVYAEYEPTMQAMLTAYSPQPETIDAELRLSVLTATMKRREAEIFPVLAERYPQETQSDLRDELVYTLTMASAPEHTQQLLGWLERPDIIRPQDHSFFTYYLLNNQVTRRDVRQWIITHWDYLLEMVGYHGIDTYTSYLARTVYSEAERQEFEAFAHAHRDDPALAQVLKTAPAIMTRRLRLLRDDQAGVWARLREL